MTTAIGKKQDRLSGNLFRLLPYLLAALLWVVLAFHEQYFLKKVEDLSLFMFDGQYISDALRIPGGFIGIAGSFFTQFLYIPWVGSLVWVFMLLLIYQLTIKAFNIPQHLGALAIILPVLLAIADMSLGYGIFIIRQQDYFFTPLIGCIAALLALLACKRIKSALGRTVFIILWTAAGYPLLGTYALAGTLTIAVYALFAGNAPFKERLTVCLTGIALIFLVPVIAYSFYTTFRLADGWQMGLPTVSNISWAHAIKTPFVLALLFLPVPAIASRWFQNAKGMIFQIAVYVCSIAAVWGFWFKDSNFRTELHMSDAVDRLDWQNVIDIYQKAVKAHAKSDAKAYEARTAKLKGLDDPGTIENILDKYSERFFEPTRTMVLYRDLALLKTDRALDEAFTMKDGSRLQKSRTQIPMTLQSGKQFYFQYGLSNLCYRWCIEDAVENGWNTGTLKYMSMLSILTGEKNMAIKFLDKLDKTLFYKKWAKQNRALLADTALVAKSAPYDRIIPLMCFEDNMTNDLAKCESHLIKHFTSPRPAQATPQYDLTALFWTMRTQNIPDFWERFYYYLRTNQSKTIPRSIQEAAILYNSLESHGVELSYAAPIKESYSKFTQYVQRHTVRTIRESSYPYSQQFGKTFYYYYYFIRDLQTY